MVLDASLLNTFTALVVGYAIFIVFVGLAGLRTRDSVQLRIDHYASRVHTLEEIEFEQPFQRRVLQPLLRALARLLLRFAPRIDLDELQLKLHRAGNPNNLTPVDFLGLRALSSVVFALPAALLLWTRALPMPNGLFVEALLIGLGFLLPGLWLGRKIRARQKEIMRNLPDALDLLTVSVEAGLALEAAMAKVAERTDNELGRAFARALAEVQLGRGRAEALRDMANRADVSDLNHFMTAMIQAEQLGVSVAKVLRIQSDEIRLKRRQRAEEEAHRAPVKMSVVLVLLLLPSLFLIILGPSVQRVCHQLSPNNRLCG